MRITLTEAAALARITKQGIRKQIQAGKLTATKDEHGRWLVDAADVQRVWPSKPKAEPAAGGAVAEAENRLLRERIADLVEDRDRWREQAERTTMLLTDQRRPWWRRLIAR